MRFNIASSLDKLGFSAEAIGQYRHYLQEAKENISERALQHIHVRMKVLMSQVGQLHLFVLQNDVDISIIIKKEVIFINGLCGASIRRGVSVSICACRRAASS